MHMHVPASARHGLQALIACARAGAQVGTGYFDAVSTVVTAGASSTLALTGSTENAQFH